MFDSIAESLEKIRLGEDALLEMTEGRFEEHYTANILHWLNFSVSLQTASLLLPSTGCKQATYHGPSEMIAPMETVSGTDRHPEPSWTPDGCYPRVKHRCNHTKARPYRCSPPP